MHLKLDSLMDWRAEPDAVKSAYAPIPAQEKGFSEYGPPLGAR